MHLKSLSFILLLTSLYYSAYADVWADRHGTTSTAGTVDTGTRYNPYSTLKPPLVLLWSQTNWDGNDLSGNTINTIQESSPAIANGIVYAGSYDSKLYAWDAANGTPITGFPVIAGGNIISSPAIANGIVYVGSQDNKLYAWDAANGTPITGFPVPTGGQIASSPAIANGIVYVGSQDNKLYAWDAANGTPITGFPVPTSWTIASSPAIANGIVYVGSWDNYLYALDATNGTPITGFPVLTGGNIWSSPAIANGIVYVGSDIRLYALDATNGTPITGFPVPTGGQIYSSPAIANGIVYVGSQDSKLYAWDAANGVGIPGFPVNLSGNVHSSPVVANGYVYIGDTSNKIYAVDITSGNIVWQYQLPSNFLSGGTLPIHEGLDTCSPAIAEDKLFVTSDEGNGIFVFSMPSPSPTITPTWTITPTFTNTPTITPTATYCQGEGSSVANPASFFSGSTGNTIVFTYTAGPTTWASSPGYGTMKITLRAGWSPPSLVPTDPGYFTVVVSGGGTVISENVSGQTIIVEVSNLTANTGQITINYGDKIGGGPGATAPVAPCPPMFADSYNTEMSPDSPVTCLISGAGPWILIVCSTPTNTPTPTDTWIITSTDTVTPTLTNSVCCYTTTFTQTVSLTNTLTPTIVETFTPTPTMTGTQCIGSGTVTKNPLQFLQGSSGNTMVITYTAGPVAWVNGRLTVVIANVFDPPSLNPLSPGYVTVNVIGGTLSGVSVSGTNIFIDVSTLSANTGQIILTYGDKTGGGLGFTVEFNTCPMQWNDPGAIGVWESPAGTYTCLIPYQSIFLLCPSSTITETVTSTATLTVTASITQTATETALPSVSDTPTFTPTITITPTPYPEGDIVVYPNPYDPNKAIGGALKIINLPVGASVCIYTLSGEFTYSQTAQTSFVHWNGKNLYDNPVSPGVYYYIIKLSSNIILKTGKIFVIH